jgi:uncharacterized protein YicC (UPF0701 family)
MPPPSPEVLVENLRRTLHVGIAHYAALRREALRDGLEDELLDLSLLLGLEWPGAAAADELQRHRRRLEGLLDSLIDAAREDQQATRERRGAALAKGADASRVRTITLAVDRWLERWLSGPPSGRMP